MHIRLVCLVALCTFERMAVGLRHKYTLVALQTLSFHRTTQHHRPPRAIIQECRSSSSSNSSWMVLNAFGQKSQKKFWNLVKMVEVFLLSWLMPSPCHASPLWSLRHGFISSWQRCQRHTPIIEPSDGREESANNNITKCPLNYPTQTTANNVVTHQPTESASFRFVMKIKLHFFPPISFSFIFLVSIHNIESLLLHSRKRFYDVQVHLDGKERSNSFVRFSGCRAVNRCRVSSWVAWPCLDRKNALNQEYLRGQRWRRHSPIASVAIERETGKKENRCKLYWNFFRRSETKRNIK